MNDCTETVFIISADARLLAKLSESFMALCSQAPLRPADEAPYQWNLMATQETG